MTPSTARRAAAVAALLCTAALTAACGYKQPGSSTGPASTRPAASSSPAASPTAASPSPSAASTGRPATAGCASSALRATVNLAQAGAAAGSIYYPIDFTNVSGSACTLFGYPGVSFATGPSSGTRIGRAAHRNPAVKATTVTLAPGQVAHATLQVAEAGNYPPSDCKAVRAHWLKIYPPNQVTPIYARFTVQACSAMLPHHGSQLGIYVVRHGPGKTGRP